MRRGKPNGRIAVVGAGAAGLSAAVSAAAAGFDVVVFERDSVGSESASSAGEGKIIRYGYRDPFFAHLMAETQERWRALEEATGSRLVERCGTLQWGPAAGAGVRQVQESLAATGQPFEVLGHGAAALRGFGLTLSPGEAAVYEPGGGLMRPEAVFRALRHRAEALGVEIREHAPVRAVEAGPGGPVVVGAAERFPVDRVIVAAGPRVLDFVPAFAGVLSVSRQYQIVCRSRGSAVPGRPWSWLDVFDDSTYGMVNHRPGRHIIGAHVPEHLGDSDRPVAPGEQERHVKDLISVLEARIGVAHGGLEVEATRVCHYTNTRTEDFIVCPHPDDDRITVLSACSGHGFKFTITSGHYAAMTAVGNPVPDAGRFAAHI